MRSRMTIPDWRTPRRNCRIGPAARSSRPLRPPRHDRQKGRAEAPRRRRLTELALDLIDKRVASSRPRSSGRAYSSALEIGVTRKPHVELHPHDKFDRIIKRCPRWQYLAGFA